MTVKKGLPTGEPVLQTVLMGPPNLVINFCAKPTQDLKTLKAKFENQFRMYAFVCFWNPSSELEFGGEDVKNSMHLNLVILTN